MIYEYIAKCKKKTMISHKPIRKIVHVFRNKRDDISVLSELYTVFDNVESLSFVVCDGYGTEISSHDIDIG